MTFKTFITSGAALALALSAVSDARADTLQDALISVYNKNPRLQAERARLREVDETYIQARAQGRFTANASASYARGAVRTPVTGGIFSPAQQDSDIQYGAPKSGQVQIVQPVYQGGRVKALKRQAAAGILSAREGLRTQENNIFLAAANAYVDVRRDEETARIRRNNVRVLDRQLEAADARFEVGEGTRTDIAQSRARLAQAESGLAQAEAQLEISRATYRRIVGRQPADLQPVPRFILPPDLPTAIARARDNNPQLLASYYNEESGRAAIDVAKAAGRPTVSLTGSLTSQRDPLLGFGNTDQAQLAAQVNIPIFSGGLNKSRVRQAKFAKQRLAFETRDTELAVDQTITQIWAQRDAAEFALSASRQQVEAAEIAFEGVKLEQTVGTRTQLDVLNAEQELLNAQLSVVEAQRALDSATFQLLSTIGVFDADGIDLPVEIYDDARNLEVRRDDGYKRALDDYVPVAVRKIGRQVPDMVGDIIDAGEWVVDKTELDKIASQVPAIVTEPVKLAVDGVNAVTFQEAEDALFDAPGPIITEPLLPPSRPPVDPDALVAGEAGADE